MSGLVNKIKETVSGHSHESSTTNTNTGRASEYGRTTGSGATGLGGASAGGIHSSEYGSGTTGRTTGGAGGAYGNEASRHTAGPHSSDLGNKLDPASTPILTTAAPLARRGPLTAPPRFSQRRSPRLFRRQQARPRIDSDRDHRGAYGTGVGAGAVGTGAGVGAGAGAIGNRESRNTAGPHSSDLANKLDPASILTLTGARLLAVTRLTPARKLGDFAGKNPRDAAQVPPSILKKEVGGVETLDDDHSHRHGKHIANELDNPDPASPLGAARPAHHHAHVRAGDAVRHLGAEIQLPRPAAAPPGRLLSPAVLELPPRRGFAAQFGRGPAAGLVSAHPAVEAHC
ncbi:unnamed protein product [Parascedosporium putredinis]|uniref:Uncharacterized protein n=1 Tax=Parascedosporium putredinis TaxID=1442378 RepID=A0A9P1M9I8_9PEZI|nr:unnamed protein product [Parascedosporium putredinis]CAI7995733.1 unnamed protein product [Parascedosporium putredinis]